MNAAATIGRLRPYVPVPLKSWMKGGWFWSFRWLPPSRLSELDLCVCSYGGVGTTFLIHHLARFLTCNDHDDRDRLKHMPAPPVRGASGVRFLYICGDPIDATLSLLRRDFARLQARKNGVLRPRLGFEDLDSLLERGPDPLGITGNLRRWADPKGSGPPVLMVRYERLWDVVPAVAEYLSLPRSFVDEFPERRERQSRVDALTDEQRRRLERMYEPAYRILSEIGDLHAVRWS